MKIFQETLEPLLKERRIFYEVRVTQKPKEVEEFFQTSTAISLREKYSAIVILSGDGLLFEAIQGLYKRTISPEEESPKNHKVRNETLFWPWLSRIDYFENNKQNNFH